MPLGVLVPDPDGEGFRFESASGAMEPGEYRVMLKAESGAFVTADGLRLDGDGDGLSGGDFRGQARVGKATARGEERPDSGATEPHAPDPATRNLLVNEGLGGLLDLFLLKHFVHRSIDQVFAARLLSLGFGRCTGNAAACDGFNPVGDGKFCLVFDRAQHSACVFGQNGVVDI